MRCGWGGMLTFLVLRTLFVDTLQRSLVLLLHYMLLRCRDPWCCCYVICCYAWINLWCCCYLICCYAAHDGVGWGVHVNVPCTSRVKCCYAAEISVNVAYVICCYSWINLWYSLVLLLRYMLLRCSCWGGVGGTC